MSNTWESDSGNVSETPATATTTENKYVQFVVPSFSLIQQGYAPNAAVPNASDIPATLTYGNSFLRMGSFPVATTPSASDPSSFATSFALANELVANEISDDQSWDSGNVSDDKAMLSKGGIWDHTDGNRVVTTYGDKIEVVNGNYAIQVNGSDTVPVTSSTSAPYMSSMTGAPGTPIGAGGSTPGATLPIAGQMPSTTDLQRGDIFAGTWANRILTYTGSQGNTVPLVYSATYAGTVASITTASAVLTVTAAADVTTELICVTQQSASQIGVDGTLYIAGASLELDIIPGIQATEALIGVGQASDTHIIGFSLSNLNVGGAITSNQAAGGLILSNQTAVGAVTSTTVAGAAILGSQTAVGAVTSLVAAGAAVTSTTTAGAAVTSTTTAGAAIITNQTAGAAILNTTTATGNITTLQTAPLTTTTMNGVCLDIHAGIHNDQHAGLHVEVHEALHTDITNGHISVENQDAFDQVAGTYFKNTTTGTWITDGDAFHIGDMVAVM